jgi:hypothetical protein
MKFRSERDFTDAVIDLAKMNGWLVHHDRGDMHRHIQGHAGVPDLLLVKGGRAILAELKKERGQLTDSQDNWRHAIDQTCVEYYLWRPVDFEEIVKCLGAVASSGRLARL